MEPTPGLLVGDEHDLYPVHEEDHVPQGTAHFRQIAYLVDALEAYRPDLRLGPDHCLYWERGNTQRYVAADVAVIEGPRPEPPLDVYLAWRDPPLLLVVEIASESSRDNDTRKKFAIYERDLKVPEYLYADPERRQLQGWRLVEGHYRPIRPDPAGRIWSAQLQLWFGFDESGFLRIYTPNGEMLLTHRETQLRAEEEARRAEEEARARAAAERRVAELEAELARLRQGKSAP